MRFFYVGLIAFLFLLALPSPSLAVSCNAYESGMIPPTGYGASWNTLSSAKELLLLGECTSAGAPVSYTAGAGNSNHYVYKLGYVYSTSWQPFTMSGSFVSGSNDWLSGQGTYTNNSPPSTDFFWVGYVCQWTGSLWKCGCRDSACTTSYWQLQQVKFPSNGGSSGGGDGFKVGAYYPEYGNSAVSHSQIPWALLDELYYFAVFPRVDVGTSLNANSDIFVSASHPFTSDTPIQLRNINDSATPTYTGGKKLAYDTNYWPVNVVAGQNFQLSLTKGGAPINFSDSGLSNGRRFKAPKAYASRYQFGGTPLDVATVNDLIAKRNANNPNTKLYLTIGGAHSVQDFKDALDYQASSQSTVPGSGAGVNDLMNSIAEVYNQGFDGLAIDIEPLRASGTDGLGGDGIVAYNFGNALRNKFPNASIAHYVGRTGPADTGEYLSKRMLDEGLIDYLHFSGYAILFPGYSGGQVRPHNALYHDQSDYGAPTGNSAVGQIEGIQQLTSIGVSPDVILMGDQAGGTPWVGGKMTSPSGSVGHGARFPGDLWSGGGGSAPSSINEVTYRNRGTLNLTGTKIDQKAVSFFGWRTASNPSDELYWASADPVTLAAKREYWKQQGLRGIFIWTLTGDDPDFPLVKAMRGM